MNNNDNVNDNNNNISFKDNLKNLTQIKRECFFNSQK